MLDDESTPTPDVTPEPEPADTGVEGSAVQGSTDQGSTTHQKPASERTADEDPASAEDPGAEPDTDDSAVYGSAAKAPARKGQAKKATARKGQARKATATKTTATKAPAKKAAARKTPAKKAASRKGVARKAAEAGPAQQTAAETVADTAAEAGSDSGGAVGPQDPAGSVPEAVPEAAAGAMPAAGATAAAVGEPAVGEPAVGEPTPQTAEDAASAGAPATQAEPDVAGEAPTTGEDASAEETSAEDDGGPSGPPAPAIPLFQPPDPSKAVVRKRTRKKAEALTAAPTGAAAEPEPGEDSRPTEPSDAAEVAGPGAEEGADRAEEGEGGAARRRRRRGGRRRRRAGENGDETGASDAQPTTASGGDAAARADTGEPTESTEDEETPVGTRRRRRRRRRGEEDAVVVDDPDNTVVRVRDRRPVSDDEVSGFTGSTRLEAKKQRRREGREAGRRRAPIVSEAEFLARREAVDRVMVVRQHGDVTQIGVLEDGVLVEHYVARESQTSLIGNVYLGRVQNVLPSMEAAFIDIGKGRNAVLYAGEVNWDLLGKDGQPRRIETALKSGQTVLVQVTKDPVGHKGARLTSQISLPGRYLVYMPGGQSSGISRKLPDTERSRLKNLLKEILPEDAGVIIRTAAEGASEEELRRDVSRLTARWDDICGKVEGGQAPQLLYGEPDLMIKVIRDLFTEDFKRLVVSGDDAWDMIEGYVGHVAPDLMDRVERWDGDGDVFASYRIDEQIGKALERKVWLPSGGSLVIDRTEAMTVVDVNTGKFTGAGGNLEETVTRNNLEAAEEIVRQLRLRDIGGIIVIDFIDMVLESNRDLVLRRLIECLGRDRTRHQVAEVTSLGLVQMTRKRIGTGLFEAFSEPCESCNGRGHHIHREPVEPRRSKDDDARRGRRRRGDAAEQQGEKTSEKRSGKKSDKQSGKQSETPSDRSSDEQRGKQPDRTSEKASRRRLQQASERKPDEQAEEPTNGQDQPSAESSGTRSGRQSRKAGRQRSRTDSEREAGRPEADSEGDVRESVTEPQPSVPEPPAAEQAPAPAAADSRDEGASTGHGRGHEPAMPAGAGSSDGTGPQPVTAPAPEPAQPSPPRRSRRRAATRPAGPPESGAGEHAPVETH